MRHAAALALIALAACSRPSAATNTAGNAIAASGAPATATVVAPDPRLARIFTSDILGANVAWLETITGPAFSTEGADRTYKVGACQVIVGVQGGKIANVGVSNYGPGCSFNIAQYFAAGGPALPVVPTFGDIQNDLGGAYDADCLRSCGNAADPVVSLSYSGSHADNFNGLVAQISVTEDATLNAWQDWSDKLAQKHGAAYVADGKFHQGDSLQGVADKDFAAIRPTTIRVGQDLPGSE